MDEDATYHELPRFMRTFGRETIGGVPLTILNADGVVAGFSLGRWVGQALHLPALLFVLTTGALVVLGVVLTSDYRGGLVAGRVFLLMRFWVRDLLGGSAIDGQRWVDGVDDADADALLDLVWAAVDAQEDDAPAVIQETVTRHSGDR